MLAGRLPALWRGAAALGCGGGAALVFPPYDAVVLLPLSLGGLMALLARTSGRVGFGLGFLFGLGFMLPLLRWITVIGPDAWIALAALEALFYGLMGAAWAWLRPRTWWPVGIAATWVAAELLRAIIPFGGLPWGRLAFGLVDTPLVRYGRLGGTALVSFATVLAVALVVDVISRRDPARAGPARLALDRLALARLALAAGLALGGLLVPVGTAGSGERVRVAVVQGNVPGTGMDAFAERRAVLDNHVDATEQLASDVASGNRPQPDIVLWPENASDIDPFEDKSAYEDIDRAVRAIDVPTLVGAVVGGPDPEHLQNVGIVWDPKAGPGERYVKRHPVPFGEYIPFRGFLTQYVDRLGQIPLDFARGEAAGALDLGGVRIGDVICFEVAYDGLLRDVVDEGAQLVVVQTNNATYAGTGQLEQQFAISRYRAIETGRSVVVAATNGISGVIAPDGTVRAQSAPRTRALVEAEVTLANDRTFGVRTGFWVEVALSGLGVGLVALARLGGRRRVGTMAS